MSKNPPTIYFDVTQLVHWQGSLAGIPRVMYELAIRFNDKNNVVFVSWVKEVKDYCEVDLMKSVGDGSGITYIQKNVKENNKGHSQKDDTRLAMPRKYAVLKKAVKATLKVARKVSPSVEKDLRLKMAEKASGTYERAGIESKDKVFIPWGEWWDENFLKLIENLMSEGVAVSTVIHDVGPMVTPHLSGHSSESLAEYCRRIVPSCDEVLVVSQNTKKDLTNWLKNNSLNVPSITVIRLGDDFKIATSKKPDSKDFIDAGVKGKDYLLSVGTVELKKNHQLFFYVYHLARERGVNLPKLLVVGRSGWRTEILEETIKSDPYLSEKIFFLHDVDDNELSWLYDNCLFTILASMYEGWGIPIAESICRGVPCLASGVTSMVEIAPGLVDHFSPYSADECLDGVTRLLDTTYRDRKTKSLSKYQITTWDDTYSQVEKVIE